VGPRPQKQFPVPKRNNCSHTPHALPARRIREQGTVASRVLTRKRLDKSDRLHPLIRMRRSGSATSTDGRGAVEREYGRLKHAYGLAPLRVRGLQRVKLHADLCMLARLSQALIRPRPLPLAAKKHCGPE
jgi:hypothetical protein